ncbi:MAG: hypothetical protein HC832_00545 [Leptolyngbyaceae cyanobacterium RM1_405_57]|nr:hypothetical protein [Leptolyngbyaceae cyanobacterium RM1_405_57]
MTGRSTNGSDRVASACSPGGEATRITISSIRSLFVSREPDGGSEFSSIRSPFVSREPAYGSGIEDVAIALAPRKSGKARIA